MDKNKKQNTILVVNKIDVKYKESETELAISDYHDL
jgi:predicted GTPase